MVVKTLSGDVLVDTAVVGSFAITYEDDIEVRFTPALKKRSIAVNVYIDETPVGSLTLTYDDWVSTGLGGKRLITFTGAVEVV
jgi:hypothetical protein